MKPWDVIIIGGGQAGLAAGRRLRLAGVDFLILDAANSVGGSWRHYYNSLELFSPRRYSSLPDLPMTGSPSTYPKRDDVIGYLGDYAAKFDLPVRLNSEVVAIERDEAVFLLKQANGKVEHAKALIVATGAFGAPVTPEIDGQDAFEGEILHSSEYLSPTLFASKRIIVVGAGNSAVQIGVELSEVAKVTLAVRDRVRFLPQMVLGQDIHWWFDKLRLNGTNLFSDHGVPVIDNGRYRAALRQAKPPTRPMFGSFSKDGVVWSDGTQEAVDTVIFATGFKSATPFLRDIGALDADGSPLHRIGISTTVPGLGYVGLSGQSGFASATLRGVGRDAEIVVSHLLSNVELAK